MKTILIMSLALLAGIQAFGQDRVLREATPAEMQAGTMGLPAVVTPRRAGGGSQVVVTNIASGQLVTNTSGLNYTVHGVAAFQTGTSTGAAELDFAVYTNGVLSPYGSAMKFPATTAAVNPWWPFSFVVSNGWAWTLTNTSTGSGNTANVVSSQITILTQGSSPSYSFTANNGVQISGNNISLDTSTAAIIASAVLNGGSVPVTLNGYTTINGTTNDFANPLSVLVQKSTEIQFAGGSASSLRDLPVPASVTAAGMAQISQGPPIFITTWTGNTNRLGELAVSNIVQMEITNGFYAALTNAGIKPIIELDQNVELITNSRQNGSLAINTQYFPSGKNFLGWITSNSWAFMPAIYASEETNSTSFLANDSGTPFGSGSPLKPVIVPSTVLSDVNTLRSWGSGMIRFADLEDGSVTVGGQLAMSHLIADSILFIVSGNYAYNYLDAIHSTPNSQPIGTQFMTDAIGDTTPQVFTEQNSIQHDFRYAFPGQINSSVALVTYMSQFRSCWTNEMSFESTGHSGTGFTIFNGDTTNNIQCQLADALMTYGALTLASATNAPIDNSILASVTNALFLQAMAAPFSRSYKLFDYGATNTSGWYRDLPGGKKVVCLVNEMPTTTTNLSFTSTQIGLLPNQVFNAQNIWDGSSAFALGSFSMSLGSNNVALIVCTPTAYQPVPGLITNVVFTLTNDVCVTNTTAYTNVWTFSVPAGSIWHWTFSGINTGPYSPSGGSFGAPKYIISGSATTPIIGYWNNFSSNTRNGYLTFNWPSDPAWSSGAFDVKGWCINDAAGTIIATNADTLIFQFSTYAATNLPVAIQRGAKWELQRIQ